MITNGHITIYNKYIDAGTRSEKYQRAEIRDVYWQGVKGITHRKEQLADNTALILIPFARGDAYAKPKAWQGNRIGWTLQEGDVIVREIVTQEIAGGYTLADLFHDYDDVVIITSVNAMDQGSPIIQHWEVGAK